MAALYPNPSNKSGLSSGCSTGLKLVPTSFITVFRSGDTEQGLPILAAEKAVMLIFSTTFLVILRDSKDTAPAGGGLGPVEPVRDVPNGRERHGHTILGDANCSSAPGRFLLRIGPHC
jgi:hypothetical protein